MLESEGLKEFVEENKPQGGEFSVEQLKAAAQKAGFAVGKPWGRKDKFSLIRNGGQTSFHSTEITVSYFGMVNDGHVEYVPTISGYSLSSGNQTEELALALGFSRVKVALPEPIVQIPCPPWAWGWDECSWTHNQVSMHCFASEAKQMVSEHVEELRKLGFLS